jgi:hypothetical protein
MPGAKFDVFQIPRRKRKEFHPRSLFNRPSMSARSATSPHDYFPLAYCEDLKAFSGASKVPSHGPFGLLCGRTMGALFEPANRDKYRSATGFLCTLYCLNLLHQGIYTHFPSAFNVWAIRVAPFVDARGCTHAHGGWNGLPNAILAFAQDPSYIPSAVPVHIENSDLSQYLSYFLFEYLPTVLPSYESMHLVDPTELLSRLRGDDDCAEIRQIAAEPGRVRRS